MSQQGGGEPDPGPSITRPGQRARIVEQLRSYASGYAELARHAARSMDLHVSDTVALSEVIWAETCARPLSPARLSERVGLTSGATNALVNRLEDAGYVQRHREGADRRVVTLRATAAARQRTEVFTAEPARRLDAALDHLDPATLDAVEAALTTLTTALQEINDDLTHHHDPPAEDARPRG